MFKRCHKRSKVKNDLVWLKSGADFLNYLDKVKENTKPMPAIVLLDIGLPGESGLDLLQQVRSEPFFSVLPTIGIFTVSDAENDRRMSNVHGADGF